MFRGKDREVHSHRATDAERDAYWTLERVGSVAPLLFFCFFIKFADSRHAQLSIYAVFDEESDFQVINKEIRRLEAKKNKNEEIV